jgi:YD repeat-containing protein
LLNSGPSASITDRDGSAVSFSYDGGGRLTGRTAKNGRASMFNHDYGWMPSGSGLPSSASRSYTLGSVTLPPEMGPAHT